MKRLLLNETTLTDDGLKRLGRLKSLESLDLRGTKITGRALSHLQSLPRLKHLQLCDTHIDDGAIDALHQICSLVAVALPGTHVTADGLANLQMAGFIADEPVDARTAEALFELTDLDFKRQWITDVLDYLKARHEVEIQPEPELRENESFIRRQITARRRGHTLLEALHELLLPQRFVLVYRHGVLQIMSPPLRPAVRVPILNDGEVLSPKLAATLSETTELDFSDQPLTEVVAFLVTRNRVALRIDGAAFVAANRATDAPINRSIKGITLRSALGLLLEPLDLVCVAEGETLVIRPQDEVVANDRRNCALPVGDGP